MMIVLLLYGCILVVDIVPVLRLSLFVLKPNTRRKKPGSDETQSARSSSFAVVVCISPHHHDGGCVVDERGRV
eukprot:scaffold9134_cov170-Amphora_coffeaeformis.AAC.3